MIEFKDVSKKFNGRYVLKNINLTFPRFGLVIINGPSGCGKSTLLNTLSSLLDFEGDIFFDGKSYQNMKEDEKDNLRNKKIGFVFQDYKLFEFETVKENIMLSINMSSVDKENKKEKRLTDLLTLVGLSHKAKDYVSNLSGGEKQRVAIARALANSPSILLADEPTGNLDEKNTIMVMELLKRISSSSLVVMVSHDEEMSKKYADRIIQMKDGEVVFDIYQNKNKHDDYLPILKLKYDNKRIKVPFKFLIDHTVSSIKRRKWRTMFITLSTSLGLIGIGLASVLGDIVSSNLYRSYSSIIDSDKVIVSNKVSKSKKDVITAATLDEVNELVSANDNVDNVGVYYWNINSLFPNNDFLCIDSGGIRKPLDGFTSKSVNEFGLISDYKGTIYPKREDSLQDNEVVLSLPMMVINEICYQLQIDRTINSLSNYIDRHELQMNLCFSNDNWSYSVEIPLLVKGFILSTKTIFYHTNVKWNEVVFEQYCLLPTTNQISSNSAHPWDLKKTYYLTIKNKRDEFLAEQRFSKEKTTYDFEILDKKYYPTLYKDESTYNCYRLAALHRTNKDDIPSFVGSYFKSASKDVNEIIYGTESGYSIYGESLMMGFSKPTYISSNKDYVLDMADNMSYIKYEDSLNVSVPNEVIEGHFSKSSSTGFIFDPHYQIISGREPVNYQEILISTNLANRLCYTSINNQFLYLSFPIKENLLSNGFISREYETVSLKIVGITDGGKLSISHKETWSILFFQTMFGVSSFDLRISNIALRVNEGKENIVIDKITRAFPNLIANAPLQDIKASVNKICGYIEIIMLVVSISSVIIASLILFICNHLHYMETKKDIGLVRCLGVKEKESHKFIYCHSFIMTGLSFLMSSLELFVASFVLSKTLASTLMIESIFVFNPLAFIYMLLVALFISLVSSLFTSSKISKLQPLECLK